MMSEMLWSRKRICIHGKLMRTYCQGKVKFTIQQTHRMIRANKYAAGNDYSLLCVCVLVSGVRFVYFPMPKTPTREHRLWQAEGDRVGSASYQECSKSYVQ
jgi:hypothetical protein